MEINLDEKTIKYFRRKLIKWEKENFIDFPWRHSTNKWHSLVVEMMLQRTKAEQVVPIYLDFCKKYKTPKDYLVDENANVFETLGLPQRNIELKKLSKVLLKNPIPESKEDLIKLNGVGEYIAAAYRSLHLDKLDVIIDSNVVRLYGRFFGFDTHGETRRKKWFIDLANVLTSQRNFYYYNYSLIDFTKNICKHNPLCGRCILRRKCAYCKGNK